jgi:hypothetical protein
MAGAATLLGSRGVTVFTDDAFVRPDALTGVSLPLGVVKEVRSPLLGKHREDQHPAFSTRSARRGLLPRGHEYSFCMLHYTK